MQYSSALTIYLRVPAMYASNVKQEPANIQEAAVGRVGLGRYRADPNM